MKLSGIIISVKVWSVTRSHVIVWLAAHDFKYNGKYEGNLPKYGNIIIIDFIILSKHYNISKGKLLSKSSCIFFKFTLISPFLIMPSSTLFTNGKIFRPVLK